MNSLLFFTSLSSLSPNIIVLADFNIHMDNVNNNLTILTVSARHLHPTAPPFSSTPSLHPVLIIATPSSLVFLTNPCVSSNWSKTQPPVSLPELLPLIISLRFFNNFIGSPLNTASTLTFCSSPSRPFTLLHLHISLSSFTPPSRALRSSAAFQLTVYLLPA